MVRKALTKVDFEPRVYPKDKPLPPAPSAEVKAARIAWLRRKMEELGKKKETRAVIIARWRAILADPNTLPAFVTMARQALRNLHADEGREPGQDDEEAA